VFVFCGSAFDGPCTRHARREGALDKPPSNMGTRCLEVTTGRRRQSL